MSSQGPPQPRREWRHRSAWPPRLSTLWMLAALMIAVATRPAAADTGAPAGAGAGVPLGRLEQESVDEALAERGITIDPHPDGKNVRAIQVVNQEVFSRRDWWFRWFNIFHRTTREPIIEREVLLRPGQRYDQLLVEESVRNLQAGPGIVIGGQSNPAPELSSVIVILPVITPAQPSDTVDLLVVTRDIFSLRFNTNFEFQQNTLSLLATSLSENNLFGWRKFFSLGLSLNLGTVWTGPVYFDPNIAGTRLTLYAAANAYYTRATGHYEGDNEIVALRYPLFSLASRWGAGLEVVHQDTLARRFRGTSPRLVNLVDVDADPLSPTLEAVPYVYRAKVVSVDVNLVRQFGHAVIQRVTIGHRVSSQHAEVPGDFPDPARADLFLAAVAPIPETRSEPYIQYDAFTPRYAVYRDLNTFDLRENRTLGPLVSLQIAYGSPALGADFRAIPMGASAGWTIAPGGGLASVLFSAGARLRAQSFIDQLYQGQVYLASPLIGRGVRLIASGNAQAHRNDTQRGVFLLGGDTGLRGYAIGDFIGTSLLLGHVELRTLPAAVFSQRLGGVLFYDVGDAAPSFGQMFAKHDFGLGLRWLIPQLNSSVVRVDWAVATQSTSFTRAGLPGRFTAGFQQIF